MDLMEEPFGGGGGSGLSKKVTCSHLYSSNFYPGCCRKDEVTRGRGRSRKSSWECRNKSGEERQCQQLGWYLW